jgi:hypothetical protein
VGDRETGSIEKRTLKKDILSRSKEKEKGQKRKDSKCNDEGTLKWSFDKQTYRQ